MGTKKDDSKKNAEAGGKRFTFSLSLSAVIGISTVLVISIVWAFVFGLIVGRGYQPEEVVPELKHIMPDNKPVAAGEPLRNTADTVNTAGTSAGTMSAGSSGASGENRNDRQSGATQKKEEILKPEELDFFEQLKKKPEAPAPRPAEKPVKKAAPKPEPEKAQVSQPAKQDDTRPNAEMFDYTYQLAAFRDNASAQQFSSRVNDMGYRTVIRSGMASGVRWYRVFVLFRGTPEQTRDMKADMLTLGVKKPLLKGKEAVGR